MVERGKMFCSILLLCTLIAAESRSGLLSPARSCYACIIQ